MTLLVAWIGVDSRSPASAYIASDSRVTWKSGKNFDYARKLFAFKNHPDILGYCGDVLFPSMVLGQISELADSMLLFDPKDSPDEKISSVQEHLIKSFKFYPKDQFTLGSDRIEIIHVSRRLDGPEFCCRLSTWSPMKEWQHEDISSPVTSQAIVARGSGSREYDLNMFNRYSKTDNKDTSRNVFHCFCDELFNTANPTVGGAPQLVGIYRKPNSFSRVYGVIRDSRKYVYGMEVNELKYLNNIEWRNDLFELCDGETGRKYIEAQTQPDTIRRSRK